MNSTLQVKKWGNTAAVRLPKKIIEAAHVSLNQELEVSVQGKTIVLKPIMAAKRVSLEDVLSNVHPSDIEGEMAWSADTGNERFS